MKIIGLTGGIGSGKSTVANYFANWGVPVYFADQAAKEVMESKPILSAISSEFGTSIFVNGILSRKLLADTVFNDPQKLAKLNAIVHPAVKKHFTEWLLRQKSTFVIREAAILFESGSYSDCDAVITVVAPLEDRLNRVVNRDNTTREAVLKRIENQWSDEMRIAKSDFVIYNTDLKNTQAQTRQIFDKLMIQQNID